VDSPRGLGPAAARNRGAALASGDVVLFVDSDVIVHPNAISRVRQVLRSDPVLTAVFGAYDAEPEAPGAVSGFRNLLSHHVHTHAAGPSISFWAGLGAIRREEFLRVGGFDDRRYPHPAIEDIELGMRLTRAGHRIVLDPRIRGTHLKHWTLRRMVVTDFWYRGVPWTTLVLERRLATRVLNLSMRHRLSALAAAASVGSVAYRRPATLLGAGAVLVWLNRDFYALIYRARGPREAAAGVALHALHHLTSAAAASTGVTRHVVRYRLARRIHRTATRDAIPAEPGSSGPEPRRRTPVAAASVG
jgi:glycosyltransferase involved in cell wall biosynthesis